jgi:hypothetical protein
MMMSINFHAVLMRRNELLHRLAVWKEIVEHLTKFLDTDAFPASVGIRTDGGGMTVPQENIEAVLNEVKNDYVAEIEAELKGIDAREVKDHVKQAKRFGKKTKKEGEKSERSDVIKTISARPKSHQRKAGSRK